MKRTVMSSDDQDLEIMNKVPLVERNLTPCEVSLVNPNRIAKKTPNDLVELATAIKEADDFIKTRACNQLQVIVDQMEYLKQQAFSILRDSKQQFELHHVACNFKKIPGHIYYLYERPSGQKYFSMISPKEWGKTPHEFLGCYRLESDLSWTPEEKFVERENQMLQLHKIFEDNIDETAKLNRSRLLLNVDVPMDY